MGKLKKETAEDAVPVTEETTEQAPDAAVSSEAEVKEVASGDPVAEPIPQVPRALPWWKKLLRSKKFRVITPIVVLLLVALVLFVEPVKFAILNMVTSGSAEFVVVDDTTLVPIEKARIAAGGQKGETDKNGKLTLRHLKFGTVSYDVQKETYTTRTQSVKVKPGGAFVGPIKLHSQGVPVTITGVNKLTKGSMKDFKVAIEGTEISAQADDKGTAIVKIPSDKLGELMFVITADGFNAVKQKVAVKATGNAPTLIELTPAGKHYFLSNRNGKVGVYSANLDGTEQVEVVPGKIGDDSGVQLAIAPDGKHAALVSRRDNQKGPNGRVMPALFAIDLEQKTIKRIDEGVPQFSIIGWATNNHIVYSISYEQYDRADNVKIKRADVASLKLETLHAQKNYASVYMYEEDRGHVYFENYDSTVEQYGFFSIDLKTLNKKRLYEYPVGQLSHVRNAVVAFTYENKWYELDMKNQQVKAAQQPSDVSRALVVSPNGQQVGWVETRDGKGIIFTSDVSGSNSKQATKNTNVSYIVRWASEDYIVYHVSAQSENAQYIVHIPTGTVTKISDVYQDGGFYRG